MGIKVKVGDVFLVPVKEGKFVGGQLVASWHDELYFIIYSELIGDEEVSAEQIVKGKPFILALSLEALVWHGYWRIIGNVTDNLHSIPHPFFKLDVEGVPHIVSRDRTLLKTATQKNLGNLKFRTTVAPIRIQKAVQAHFGVGDWRVEHDALLAQYAIESAKLGNTIFE